MIKKEFINKKMTKHTEGCIEATQCPEQVCLF